MVCDELPLGEKSSVVDAACPSVKGERRLEQEHKCNDGAPHDREGFDRLRGEWQDQIFLPEGKKAGRCCSGAAGDFKGSADKDAEDTEERIKARE